jgi:NAD/NADP transhydrogenase alpha subunit
MYRAAGATIADNAVDILARADILLRVQPPSVVEAKAIKEGAILIKRPGGAYLNANYAACLLYMLSLAVLSGCRSEHDGPSVSHRPRANGLGLIRSE